MLVDDVRWGLDPDNCFVLVDPESDAEIRMAMKTAAEGVGRGGLLFVHYVGPIELTSSGGLRLRFPDCGFSYEEIRYRVRFNGGTRRLVILDCRAGTADADAIADAAFERGVLVVCAPGATDQGNDFTGHVVEVLENGRPNGRVMLGPQEFRQGFAGTVAMRPSGTADHFALIRNPALFRADRTGQILLAADESADGAVILVLRYDREEGALGVVLNRPAPGLAATPNWPAAVREPEVLFDGGPVEHEGYLPLVLLHDGAKPPPTFRRIRPETGSRMGTLPLTTRTDVGVVERFRLFRGYVGWGPGELEAEVANGSLVPAEVDLDVVLTIVPRALGRLVRDASR
ncbi:YqgE/AlgH family protein [Paractinoplanes globisporus]|uniref:YqgE/AlgH family protein n=1 Tax=Paractinoplanes globisporus TaxID=113565 RepID=A0ABW6WVH5_9ACTN|nr:YqgE/AlgH family protein [Actinoplanes globisporus]